MRGSRRDNVDAKKAREFAFACLGINGDWLCPVIDKRLAAIEAQLNAAPDMEIGSGERVHSSPERMRMSSSLRREDPSDPLGLASSMAWSWAEACASARTLAMRISSASRHARRCCAWDSNIQKNWYTSMSFPKLICGIPLHHPSSHIRTVQALGGAKGGLRIAWLIGDLLSWREDFRLWLGVGIRREQFPTQGAQHIADTHHMRQVCPGNAEVKNHIAEEHEGGDEPGADNATKYEV
ncbi:hypothetical protein PSQ90_04230 [Devosia rhodophyticola]|uniref:Transposase IS111A/IS1328/IS1533 N-terminal domain-containing protein n=1 Tax=Devosia rhodophyticola TaxID=3026423 RepID=A0ABY7YZ63_9HYPH|nr:hypothetical protein [Devosia rhodophyticola]WDR06678.1 hypothetical protein PSQ90_04230 [Devosia rhodophyticola]